MNARTALLLALLPAAACRSAKEEPDGAPAPLAAAADLEQGPPIVLGTVVDAASGEPLAGAHVVAPDGSATTTGPDGRFLLKGLPRGTAGDLVATAGQRKGSVRLRPVSGGRLEVVVHVR
jgi:hypothetical protein